MKFMNGEHERFYKNTIVRCRTVDCNQRAFVYIIGLTENCRNSVDGLYNFEKNALPDVFPDMEPFGETDRKVIRLAYNLFDGSMPTVPSPDNGCDCAQMLAEASKYSISSIFNCISLVDYFIEAVKIRYEF